MNAKSLSITNTIIHEITETPASEGGGQELVMSDEVSPLDEDLRTYFRRRIVESLRLAAYPVVADPMRSGPTPDLVYELFTDESADFVRITRAMATHLYEAQKRKRSSPGLLVISSGFLDSGPCVAVLKLQKQEGLNLEPVGPRGHRTYNLEHLHRLMLTNETRVFKVALFEAAGVGQSDDVHALVSDKQRFSAPEKRMADFFLHDFLGCRLRDDPAQLTSAYFVRAEKFINERITSPEKRARYHRALLADLTSNASTVSPQRFAETHLDDGDQAAFLDHVSDGAAAMTDFPKDTDLIDSRLAEQEYVLESGIRVRGTQIALDEHATIEESNGLFQMMIEDRLSAVRGAARRR